MSTTLRQKLRHHLAAPFKYDESFNFALLLVGVASVVHIGWFVASFVAFRRRIDVATTVIVDWDPSVFVMHIRIGVALLLSVAGLVSRRMIGLFVATLALVWVGLEYVAWFFWSMRIKSNAEIQTFPSLAGNVSNLYGASYWNVVVLVLVIAVLLWGILRLIKIARSQGVQWPDGGKSGR